MKDCIFCKIINKEIKADVIAETEDLLVFKDTEPSAPLHYLIIPKEHIESLAEVPNETFIKIKDMMLQLAKDENLKAFRAVTNWGDYQAIKHLHFHYTSGFKKKDF